MNICRNVSCSGRNQARFGKYHVPASWQAFRLPGMGPESYPLVLEKGEWSPLAGENEMMVRIRNMTGKPVELAGTLAVAQGKEQQAPAVRAEMLAGGTTELRVPYSVKELETVHFKLSLRNDKQREVFSAHRILDPKPIAAVEVDSDILERGENPSLTVTLNVTRAAAPNYGVRLVARTLDGKEICSRDISAAGQTQIHETLDISKVPPKTSALEIETFVTDTKSQREVLRVKTPLRIVPSPWNNEGI